MAGLICRLCWQVENYANKEVKVGWLLGMRAVATQSSLACLALLGVSPLDFAKV